MIYRYRYVQFSCSPAVDRPPPRSCWLYTAVSTQQYVFVGIIIGSSTTRGDSWIPGRIFFCVLLKICCYGDALSTIDFLSCLFLCLASYFSFFLFLFFIFLFFPASRYVYLLRVPSSVQQSATLSKYVFYSTCSFCVIFIVFIFIKSWKTPPVSTTDWTVET